MLIFALFVIGLALVLCLLHTRAVDSALSEMRLLRFLSHNRLSAITTTAAIILLCINMFNPIPLVTGLVFIPIAAMWLIRTIQAIKESKQKTGKTDLKYTYQKMFNEHGQEIDAEAIEAFIDGRMEDLNAKIDEMEASLSDEQRGLIDAEFETGDPAENGEETGNQAEADGEGEGKGDGDGGQEGKGKEGKEQEYRTDGFKFNPGDKVKVISVPDGDKFPKNLIGMQGVVGLRLPNISLVHSELDGHGYFLNGHTLPTECLQKVS